MLYVKATAKFDPVSAPNAEQLAAEFRSFATDVESGRDKLLGVNREIVVAANNVAHYLEIYVDVVTKVAKETFNDPEKVDKLFDSLRDMLKKDCKDGEAAV